MVKVELMRKYKFFTIATIIFVVIILFSVLKLSMPALASIRFGSFIEELGLFGPLIIIGYVAISHIIAPVAGTPGILLSAALFGIFQTMVYIYLGGLISAVVNFWLSRIFGRKLVVRLVGQKTMQEIDKFAEVSGLKLLAISRVFGFALFEIISYAAGLTKIDFKKYFLITAVFSFIPAFVLAFLFRNTELQSVRTLLLWLGAIAITGIIFTFFIKKFISSRGN